MKPKCLAFPRNLVLTSSAMMAVLAPLSTSAATFTWDGGHPTSNSWGSLENWNPDGVPTFNNEADLVFNVLTRPNNFIGAIRTLRSISYGVDVDAAFQTNYQDFSGGASRVLTMDALSGNATITVDAGATGDITLGSAGGAGTIGTMALADNLDVVHNGSGVLSFNRGISGTSFGITKTGTGTMALNSIGTSPNTFTGDINLNQGKLIANGFVVATDINAAANLNLGGGTLEISSVSGADKNYTTVAVNVSSASTLNYKNLSATTFTAQFTGVSAFALNADLTVKNISTNTVVVNAFNVGRAITGSGDLIVETYNNISSSADNFSLGRVLLSGSNSTWSGDLVVAKGTSSLSGNAVNAAGTGAIIIGTAANAFGAGLTFFPTGGGGSNVTYANAVTVKAGGFRAIKGGGTNHTITFSGGVTLDGDLTVDHTWSTADRRIQFTAPISGAGGLTITRVGGSAATTARLAGAHTYLGDTTVATGASLSLGSSSLTSNISVATGARVGGNGGSTSKNLTLAAGANFIFFVSGFAPFNVTGSVSLDNTFGVASLVGGSQGEAIDWTLVPVATYTLIGTTASTFNTITNFGLANAAAVGGGKSAYFQNGGSGGLQLVVIAGVSGYDAWKAATGATGAFDQDHDNDGVDNGTEFFLVGDASAPSSTGFTALPGVTNTGGTLSVTWTKAATGYTGTYATDFVVETSSTLSGAWTAAAIGVGADKVEITGNNVKYTFPTGTNNFARLKVTGP